MLEKTMVINDISFLTLKNVYIGFFIAKYTRFLLKTYGLSLH